MVLNNIIHFYNSTLKLMLQRCMNVYSVFILGHSVPSVILNNQFYMLCVMLNAFKENHSCKFFGENKKLKKGILRLATFE